ncbi:Hypothetical protein MVR_LOCUS30 [uncultured virus]|nr:Hypothetical protein MVR_LOCUS30 [uncultured virus]
MICPLDSDHGLVMVTHTLAITLMVEKKDMASTHGALVFTTKANGKKEARMVVADTLIQMAAVTLVISWEVDMDLEHLRDVLTGKSIEYSRACGKMTYLLVANLV